MFSLIISIIAIALVVALAGASLYYGGDAFTQGNSKAVASTYVNQAQQIAAASVLADAENNSQTTVSGLETEGYLSQEPAPPEVGSWSIDGSGNLTATVEEDNSDPATNDVCEEINNQEGGTCATDSSTPVNLVFTFAQTL